MRPKTVVRLCDQRKNSPRIKELVNNAFDADAKQEISETGLEIEYLNICLSESTVKSGAEAGSIGA